MSNLEVKKHICQRSDRVKAVDIHPTEPWMLYTLYSGGIQIWNHETNTLVKSLSIADYPVRAAKFIPRKDWIVACADDGVLRIYNYHSMERLVSFEIHNDYIRALSVHPTLPLLLTCSDDTTIKLYNWMQRKVIQTFSAHTHYVMCVEFNPRDPNTFASASLDRTIKLWNINSAKENFTLQGHDRGVNWVSFCSRGDKPYLVSGSDDLKVKIWNYQTKTCIQTLTGPKSAVSFVSYHPTVPLIIAGSEDGALRLWHANTYRLEKTVDYGFDRLWCGAVLPGLPYLALGYDEGMYLVSIGSEAPVVTMDQQGKFIYASNNDVFQGNLKPVKAGDFDHEQNFNNHHATDSQEPAEIGRAAGAPQTLSMDGEPVFYTAKELGTLDIHPQLLAYSANGRFVAAMGDNEYIIYTALGWRNKCFGKAKAFAWSSDPSQYAIQTLDNRIQIFANFAEYGFLNHPLLQKTAQIEALYGGMLLGVQTFDKLYFFDWESLICIRQIEISAKRVIWSDQGDYISVITEDSLYVLKFSADAVQAFVSAHGSQIPLDGIPDAFEVMENIDDVVKSEMWLGSCFVYTNQHNKLCQLLISTVFSITHLEKPFFLLGYLPSEEKIYLIDKEMNVIAYTLHLSVIEYQTCVLKGNMQGAQALLLEIPVGERTRLARFLEAHRFLNEALEISTDHDHKFNLAIEMKRIDIAYAVATEANDKAKWKVLGDLALKHWNYDLAVESLTRSHSLQTLFVLFATVGDAVRLKELALLANQEGIKNLAFLGFFLTKDVEACFELLMASERYSEAALFAKTYVPSKMGAAFNLWIKQLKAKDLPHIARQLAHPETHKHLFPELEQAIELESKCVHSRSFPLDQGIPARKHLFASLSSLVLDGNNDALLRKPSDLDITSTVAAHLDAMTVSESETLHNMRSNTPSETSDEHIATFASLKSQPSHQESHQESSQKSSQESSQKSSQESLRESEGNLQDEEDEVDDFEDLDNAEEDEDEEGDEAF